MTIQDQIMAIESGDVHKILMTENWNTQHARLTRVLALVKAADKVESNAEDPGDGIDIMYCSKTAWNQMAAALAALRAHGDIPADGMTREGPI